MNLRVAMCEALVDGWNGDWKMGRVVAHAWNLINKIPKDDDEKYALAKQAVKADIYWGTTAKIWIAKNMPRLNDSLWAGRKRDTCIACAKHSLGNHHTGRAMYIGVRERDKTHDWNTVK